MLCLPPGASDPQTCEKSDAHAALRAAMLSPLVVDGASEVRGGGQKAGADNGGGAVTEQQQEALGEEQLAKIRRVILRAEEQREPLPEHVDARALQPALKLIESVERDPVLYKALLSLPLLKPDPKAGGSKKGGGGRGRKVGGGGKAGSSSARPRLNLQQEVAHLLALGVANRSLQTVLVGLKALLTLYESTTAISGGAATTPQPQQPAPAQQPQPPPELPQCGPVLRSLGRVRLPVWPDYLCMLEEEEEAERAQAVRGE